MLVILVVLVVGYWGVVAVVVRAVVRVTILIDSDCCTIAILRCILGGGIMILVVVVGL